MKNKTLLLCFLLAKLAVADLPTVPIEQLSDPTPWLIAKVESVKDPHWYGTAILFEVTDAEFLFVTNRHVLPRDAKRFSEIHLRSPLRGYESLGLRVVGSAPGHDLAVVALPRTSIDKVNVSELQKVLTRVFVTQELPATLRQGIAGFPGIQEYAAELRPAVKTDPWLPWFKAGMETGPNPFRLSPEVELTKLSVCPPPFLTTCYRSPISSLGFSGGALNVETTPSQLQIAGIVSYFSPLTSQTFIIPMSVALRVAKQILAHGDLLVSDDGKYRYLADDSISVEATKMILKKAAPGGTSPGGHDGAGGGGESGPGGHDGAGGGGGLDAAGTSVIANEHGNLALIGVYSKLHDAIAKPKEWNQAANPLRRVMAWMPSFKGVTALLDYRPGVLVDKVLVEGLGNEPVLNLSDFLRQWGQPSHGFVTSDYTRGDWPKALGILASRDLGRRAYGDIRHFRTPKEMSNLDTTWKNDTSFVFQKLGSLMAVHGKTPGVDLLVTFSSWLNHAPIRVAQVSRVNGTVNITLLDSVWGSINVAFSDDFKQEGALYFHYDGAFQVEIPKRPWDANPYKGRAMGSAFLQYSPEERLWEMKLLFAYEPTVATDPGKTVLSPDSIRVDGFYLPLTEISAKPPK